MSPKTPPLARSALPKRRSRSAALLESLSKAEEVSQKCGAQKCAKAYQAVLKETGAQRTQDARQGASAGALGSPRASRRQCARVTFTPTPGLPPSAEATATKVASALSSSAASAATSAAASASTASARLAGSGAAGTPASLRDAFDGLLAEEDAAAAAVMRESERLLALRTLLEQVPPCSNPSQPL